jgi:hypothetical protein
MASTNAPDFTKGFPADDLQNGGMIQCRVGDEDVILARHADEFFAVGAGCTHYHGPLAEGLIVGDELRFPYTTPASVFGLAWLRPLQHLRQSLAGGWIASVTESLYAKDFLRLRSIPKRRRKDLLTRRLRL